MKIMIKTHTAFVTIVAWLGAARRTRSQPYFVASTAAHESAARTYRSIWEQDGARIIAALEARTCMRFPEAAVAALIGDDVSDSGGPEHPMSLRASYDLDVKRATLVHELGHRHLWQLDGTARRPRWAPDAVLDPRPRLGRRLGRGIRGRARPQANRPGARATTTRPHGPGRAR